LKLRNSIKNARRKIKFLKLIYEIAGIIKKNLIPIKLVYGNSWDLGKYNCISDFHYLAN
jgi:hypothetical protein